MKNLYSSKRFISKFSLYNECWPSPVISFLSKTFCLIRIFPITLISYHLVYFLACYLLTFFELISKLRSRFELVSSIILSLCWNIWIDGLFISIWWVNIFRYPFISCWRMNNSKICRINFYIISFWTWIHFWFGFVQTLNNLARCCMFLC